MFGKKKTEDKKVEEKVEVKKEAETKIAPQKEDLSWVIASPRITEKTAFLTGNNGYTFNVSQSANKVQIKKAIKEIYKVDPIKVNIVNQASRKTVSRGRKIHKSGQKKAVVFLKKGDKIEFV